MNEFLHHFFLKYFDKNAKMQTHKHFQNSKSRLCQMQYHSETQN